jgi:hypothetical protein
MLTRTVVRRRGQFGVKLKTALARAYGLKTSAIASALAELDLGDACLKKRSRTLMESFAAKTAASESRADQ